MNTQILKEGFKSKQPVSRTHYISYHSIYKGTFVLKVFLKLYCPIYNISNDEFFECYPLLAFIEYLIYETDEELENKDNQNNSSLLTKLSPWDSRKRIIESLLKEFNLDNATILNQLEAIGEYIKLENKLITSEKVAYEDVIRASELRPTDFRILHCALVNMSGRPYRPEIFDLMLPREVLMEFGDDIISYKKDVAAGGYNTYWMFEKLYGEEAHHYLKAEVDRYRNLFEERLKQFPEEEQEIYSVKWTHLWQRFSFLSSAELIRKTALEGI